MSLKDKKFWIFDLDNTLYSESTGIFNKIDENMKLYISKELNVSLKEAFILQKKLFRDYGTTLFGLMKFYNIDPINFLNFVHDINLSNLKKSSKLSNLIESLPGKKIVFTNGDEKWAKKILEALGIERSIHHIFDIIKSNYIPKPQKQTYINFIKKFKIDPCNSVFFEDTKRNLKYAHSLGMTTIHINEKNNNGLEKFIDFQFSNIKLALNNIINNM